MRAHDPPRPVRGTPGGWVDHWDDPEDVREIRARLEAAERQALARALALSPTMMRLPLSADDEDDEDHDQYRKAP